MPIRVFECLKCTKNFELLVMSTDTDPPRCPACFSLELQQCFTFPGTYKIKGDNSASVTPKKGMAGN